MKKKLLIDLIVEDMIDGLEQPNDKGIIEGEFVTIPSEAIYEGASRSRAFIVNREQGESSFLVQVHEVTAKEMEITAKEMNAKNIK
jgi:hypothetical protein